VRAVSNFPIYIEYLFVLFSLVSRVIATQEAGYSLFEEVFGGGGGFSLHHLGLVFLVQLHQLGQIELGLLQDLGLVYEDVLEGEDFGALVSDRLGDGVGENLFEEILEVVGSALLEHNLHHLLTDGLDLGTTGVAGGLDLAVLASGESNGKESAEVAVGGLGLDEALDEGVPFLDEGAHLVSGDGQTVEVGEALETLNFLNLELDDSPSEVLLVVLGQVSVADAENAASEGVSGDVLSSSLVAGGERGDSHLEERGGTHVVPLLFDEGVDDLLLLLSLLFEVSWVLSGSHKFSSFLQILTRVVTF